MVVRDTLRGMSEEAGRSVQGFGSGQESGDGGGGKRRKSFDGAQARAQVVSVFCSVIRWVGTIAAVLLTAHVVLTVGGANPDNGITQFVAGWAELLALGFENLFPKPEAPKLEVLLNYGLAAVFWLIITSVIVRIVRALG